MRFIRVHAFVHVLSLIDASLDNLHIYLALVSAALLGVGRIGGFSSHKFTPTFWQGWHLPIGFFCFTRCIPTSWLFACTGFSAVSDLYSLLSYLLLSWGSFLSPTFWRGFRGCRRIFVILLVLSDSFVPSDLRVGLWYWWWVFDRMTAHMAALLWDLACPSFPCDYRGSEVFS